MSSAIKRVGSYELHACVRRDNGAETWKALDLNLQRDVHVTLLAMDIRNNADYIQDFQREVATLASLHHSTIAYIQDARIQPSQQQDTAIAYFVTELIEGLTLANYIQALPRSGKLPVEIVHIFAMMALAIDYAHQQGVIHGNLKPAHVILRRTERSENVLEPVITDFGLPRLLEAITGHPSRRSLEDLFYISPEQAKGIPPGKSSDIYALGVLLYELCTGVVPFQGTRPVALLMQHASANPPLPALVNPNISPLLTRVIMRCLEKDPARRFSSAGEMALALAQAMNVQLPEHLNFQVYAQGYTLAPLDSDPFLPPGSVIPAENTPTPENRGSRNTGGQQILKNADSTAFPLRSSVLKRGGKRQAGVLVLCSIIIVTIFVSVLGAWNLFGRNAQAQPVGYAYFLNSGQLNEQINNQGVNDKVQIEFSSLAGPAQGKSYYAWLLPDPEKTEVSPVFLGKVPVKNGKAEMLFTSLNHTNLLAMTSRFLITEEGAEDVPTFPSPDRATWRYYAEVADPGISSEKDRFSLRDHFRHLLVESPEIRKVNLHGGLAIWLLQNTQRLSEIVGSARSAWFQGDVPMTRTSLIEALNYLEGKKILSEEFPDLPYLADELRSQIPLLGRNPGGDAEHADDAPIGYVYLVGLHLRGTVAPPQVSSEQKAEASKISEALSKMAKDLDIIHGKAEQLILMDDVKMAELQTLEELNEMNSAVQRAYAGWINQSTGQTEGGVLWVYSNIQRMANFSIRPYSP